MISAPQSPQNFSSGAHAAPQLGQGRRSDDPHSTQNRLPAVFSRPQVRHCTGQSSTAAVIAFWKRSKFQRRL